MTNKRILLQFKTIPTQLTEEQLNLFVFHHLSKGKRGPRSKLPFFKTSNYILKLIHTGVQWYCLPIEKTPMAKQKSISSAFTEHFGVG